MLWTAGLLASLTRPAAAAPQLRPELIVEIGAAARPIVDTRSIERLVLLEIADLDVPPPDGAVVAPLYFRVRAGLAASLRVELWQLGQPHGSRSVSTVGTEQLRTRRIALAAAELARQLRKKRQAERQARAVAEQRARERSARGRFGSPIQARLSVDGGAQGALVGTSGAWAAGPWLGTQLAFDTGQTVAIETSWLAGEGEGPASSLRWFEVGLSVAQELEVSESTHLSLGARAAAASVRLGDVGEEPSRGPLDTWSARAGLTSRFGVALSRAVSLGLGPELGVLLRPVEGSSVRGEPSRLEGVWVGALVSLRVTAQP